MTDSQEQNTGFLSPAELGLPHAEWRVAQFVAYRKALSIANSGGGTAILELATGAGKSALPTALSKDYKTLVLVHTLSLLDQYERIYGFDILKGRRQYKCTLSRKIDYWQKKYKLEPNASDCHITYMGDCPEAKTCPYWIAKQKFNNSDKAACTYKYASLSGDVHKRDGILVMDEVHSASQEFLSVREFEITEKELSKFDLPMMPVSDSVDGKGDILNGITKEIVRVWFRYCIEQIKNKYNPRDIMGKKSSDIKFTVEKLKSGLELLDEEFVFYNNGVTVEYIRIAGKARRYDKRVMTLKPLSVIKVSQDIVSQKQTVILMSGTIGNPMPLAQELGIKDFYHKEYPAPIPTNKRPVYVINNERMTYDNMSKNSNLQTIQAVKIWSFIKQLDPDWRGLILATSYEKVNFLRKFMRDRLGDRVFSGSSNTLSGNVKEFIENDKKGIISIDTIQGWGQGIDFKGELARFVVVAGVPFSNPSNRFDSLRAQTPNGKVYQERASYMSVPQACGRVSRGDKNNGEYAINIAAIADGSATTGKAMGYYPQWFKNAIISA